MNGRRLARLALGLTMLLAAGARAELPAPGPIELEADSSDIDRKNNRLVFHKIHISQGDLSISADEAQGSNLEFAEAEWVFTGAVQITRAGTRLEAKQATLSFVGHRLRRANLEGTPVAFEQKRPEAQAPTVGHAARVEYDFDKQVIQLSGDAWLSEGQNEITGDSIKYEIGAERVIAGAQEHGDRVKITIVPPPDEDHSEQTPPPAQPPSPES
jgi:lipopolysaccharide export system protein LptA